MIIYKKRINSRSIKIEDQSSMREGKKQIVIVGSRRLHKKQRTPIYKIIFKCLELQRGQNF